MLLLTLTAEVVWYFPHCMSTAHPHSAPQRYSARSTCNLDLWPKGRRSIDIGHTDDPGWVEPGFIDVFTICCCIIVIIIMFNDIVWHTSRDHNNHSSNLHCDPTNVTLSIFEITPSKSNKFSYFCHSYPYVMFPTSPESCRHTTLTLTKSLFCHIIYLAWTLITLQL